MPVSANIKKINKAAVDLKIFSGTISMPNYLKQQPMVLNFLVHLEDSQTKDHTAIFFEVSSRTSPISHGKN
ncbi:MAG: hypothetical protein ABI813_10085 [Bacteroidota bacterium]